MIWQTASVIIFTEKTDDGTLYVAMPHFMLRLNCFSSREKIKVSLIT